MEIISHRGYWQQESEKNSIRAFQKSFSLGFGTETDFRDSSQKLVISHDPPAHGALDAEVFFELYRSTATQLYSLALNVKADSLQTYFSNLIKKYDIQNYFLFDMSVPDALASIRCGLRVFTRQSEYESTPAYYEQASGIWLDSFHSTWWSTESITEHLNNGKKVCIVSPDLHGRRYLEDWRILRKFADDSHVILCTDFPEKARAYFYG